MDVVAGVDRLGPEHGPVFAVIGVFDGLHLGHAYLLDHLVREAATRAARPTVITFDHHPDEVLTGTAPPLLLDPDERLERLAAAGVTVTVVQHFDDVVRRTSHDAFVGTIASRAGLAGLLMTPDAAFGYQRAGTPEAVAELGVANGFEVVVVQPFTLDGTPVRSSDIRSAIASGDLPAAARLLGRPITIRGRADGTTVRLASPIALPPSGSYAITIGVARSTLTVSGGALRIGEPGDGPIELQFA